MGVYIKGMEMPTSCDKCPFLDYEEGFCFASGVKRKSGWYESMLCPGGIKDGRHEDCPLVPVPPHSRLIDADELKKNAYPFPCAIGTEWAVTLRQINDAPTIIPASGEGE